MKIILKAWCFIVLPGLVYAQNLQQIHGKVVEKYGQSPLPGVSVVHPASGIGTLTDTAGFFELKDIPTGRIQLTFSMIGFETLTIDNLELLAGKQLALTVELSESVTTLDEVPIISEQLENNYNPMALVSGRRFSIEETQRFAGSLNDVQRMATSFAGVRAQDDRVNDLIIRGNMPAGMLFRMDGLTVPNPNHWAMPGSAGGTISMLNTNVLKNSDFLTGAFPAEYDAFSGVMDLRTRNGNAEKHEFLAQLGFNGVEAGAEGPMSKRLKSSYLINYRKSFLGVLSKFMKSTTGSAIPDYEDLFLKVNLPSRKLGTFTVLGMGGRSHIHMKPEKQHIPNFIEEDLVSGSKTGMLALTHHYTWSPATFSTSGLLVSGVATKNEIDRVWTETNTSKALYEPYVRANFSDKRIGLSHFTQHKISSVHRIKVGAYLDFLSSDYKQAVFDKHFSKDQKQWLTTNSLLDSYTQSHAYISHHMRFTNGKLEMTTGLAHNYHSLTNAKTWAPKWGMRYRPGNRGTLSIGTGLYAKAPSMVHVALTKHTDNSNKPDDNRQLKPMKSIHLTAGYDYFFTRKLHLKTEVYYQHLYHLITGSETNTGESATFSAVNEFSFAFEDTPASLANLGKGKNYGVEVTLEQFIQSGFYYLATVSIFNSRYQAVDQKWRSTRFNTNFVTNLTGGKEFILNSTYRLLIDLRTSYSQGARYTPLDNVRSQHEQRAVYDYAQAYSHRHPFYFRADLRVGLKSDGKRISQEWAFEAQNITNRRNVFAESYDINSNSLKTSYQTGFLPIGLYRIYF